MDLTGTVHNTLIAPDTRSFKANFRLQTMSKACLLGWKSVSTFLVKLLNWPSVRKSLQTLCSYVWALAHTISTSLKATICNFDRDPWLRRSNLTMRVNTSHKATILVKPGHILQKRMPSLFSSNVLLCISAAFYSVELSSTTTHCCSCSIGLQAAYTLLSGTSMHHWVEALKNMTQFY